MNKGSVPIGPGKHPTIWFPQTPREPRGRHTALDKAQLLDIEQSLRAGGNIPDCYSFFSIAQSLFETSSLNVSTIALSVAAETAIKFVLAQNSDLTEYMLEKMPSPPIDRLITAANKFLDVSISANNIKLFKGLSERRNELVHRAHPKPVEDTEIKKWFGAVERLLKLA